MADPEPAEFELTEDFAFGRLGAVCAHTEEALAGAPSPGGNAQLVAASSTFGLVFFADALGACAAAHAPSSCSYAHAGCAARTHG